MFLVDADTPGVKITNVPRYTHTFVYEHPEFTFTDVRVGPEAVLGGVGAGLELTRDWFTEERLMIGARTIGAAERALTLAVDWATQRVQGGEPLINRQLIQGMIADSVVDITTNRAYTHQVAWEFDQADPNDADQRKTLHAKAATVKLAASEASNRVVDRARADLRRPWLHPRLPRRAAVARAAGRPDLGRHLGDPAPGHRQRDQQAGRREPAVLPLPAEGQ